MRLGKVQDKIKIKGLLSSSPNLSLTYMIVNIVVQVTNVDNALHMGKLVNHVVKRTILPQSVDLVKAKAKAKAPVVQGISHLNTTK